MKKLIALFIIFAGVFLFAFKDQLSVYLALGKSLDGVNLHSVSGSILTLGALEADDRKSFDLKNNKRKIFVWRMTDEHIVDQLQLWQRAINSSKLSVNELIVVNLDDAVQKESLFQLIDKYEFSMKFFYIDKDEPLGLLTRLSNTSPAYYEIDRYGFITKATPYVGSAISSIFDK